MSHFRLHTIKEREYLKYLILGLACLIAAVAAGCVIHSIGTARARSQETVLIFTEEEFTRCLLDQESEDYNLNGNYQLEADLDFTGLEHSIGTNVEPFTGKLDGNGHVITGMKQPLFGVMKAAKVENLFFSGAEIRAPFTYSDGEHYVDGYGALAAYVIGSEIRNCGMNGGIYTASPAEAEYLVSKASPADAEEEKGPGVEGPAGTDAAMEESSPVIEDGGNGGAAGPGAFDQEENVIGPGAETGLETSQTETEEIGPGMESTESTEAAESGSSSAESSVPESESSPAPTAGQSGETEKPDGENGNGNKDDGTTNPETDSSQPSDSNHEPATDGAGADTEPSGEMSSEPSTSGPSGNPDAESSVEAGTSAPKETEAEHATGAETEAATESVTEAGTEAAAKPAAEVAIKSATEAEKSPAMAETIGFRSNDRQHLLMKIPEVADLGMEGLQTASPSDATPAEAQPAESSSEDQNQEELTAPEEPEYIGNPNGDITILVTADRITAGGLIAEATGETLIADSFALVTIDSDVDSTETHAGGMIGVIRKQTRLENSYAAGLADSYGVTGGFAAWNDGSIQNSYSSMTIGTRGIVHGAFTAVGEGSLSGCIYDRQMACVDGDESILQMMGAGVDTENSPTEAESFSLAGMNTEDLIGTGSQIPGNWRKTENAYPQLEYFAQHENETVKASSRASVIALVLPEGLTLANVVKNGDIVLPSEIDGERVNWEAEGNVRIDERNQVVSEETDVEVSIEARERSMVKSALEETADTETTAAEPQVQESDANDDIQNTTEQVGTSEAENTSDGSTSQLKASVGNVTRSFAIAAVQSAAVTYANWGEVGAAQTEAQLKSMGALSGSGVEGDPWKIGTEEAFAWFDYYASQDTSFQDDHVELTANMNMMGSEYGGTADLPLEWIPIPSWSGVFEGGGFEIDYFYMDTTAEKTNGGLINTLRGGTVENVHIGANSNVRGGALCGSIVGIVETGGTITNCSNKGKVYGISNTGSILGGVGGKPKVTVTRCFNSGPVSCVNNAGGIIGWVSSAGTTKGTTVSDCYNTGSVTAGLYASGISGVYANNAEFYNCYNVGTLTGKTGMNGIGPSGLVSNCYMLTGGSYGTLLSMDQMKSWALPYALNGQRMDGPWQYNEGGYPSFGKLERPASWGVVSQGMADGLVTAGTLTAGDGSSSSPYVISNASQLANFAAKVNSTEPGACGSLAANIDLTGALYEGTEAEPIPWIPIGSGTSIYTGTFSGNGKIIYGMKVKVDGYAGLFGCIGGNAAITKLGLDRTCSVEAISPGTSGLDGTAGFAGAVKPVNGAVNVKLEHCYNRAEIRGKSAQTAAFIGSDETVSGTGTVTLRKCYTTGIMTAGGAEPKTLVGPGKGNSGLTIQNSYWDEIVETGYTGGLKPAGDDFSGIIQESEKKLTADMRQTGFADLLNQGEATAVWEWDNTKNNAYPVFTGVAVFTSWEGVGAAAEEPPAASSTDKGGAGNPYLIKSPEHLAWFAYQVNQNGKAGLCGKLTADISLFGGLYTGGNGYDGGDTEILNRALEWIPIGSDVDGKRYTGTFDGNGHVISKIRTAGAEKQGLFGTLGTNAAISRLGVSTSLLKAPARAGGIAGYVNGTGVAVTGCGNLGSLTGDGTSAFGGCIGDVAQTAGLLLDGCYNGPGGIITNGATYVGGVIGDADVGGITIRNCYNRGTVSGVEQVGGIAGYAGVPVTACYNAGTVSGSSMTAGIANNLKEGQITRCYYETGATADSQATELGQRKLKSWGAAWMLNGDQMSQTTGIFWDYAKGKNDEYPYPASGTPNGAMEWDHVMEAAYNGFLTVSQPSGSPYEIHNAEQLAWFAHQVNHGSPGASAVIVEDIDMKAGEERYIPISGGRLSWTPIGQESSPYSGSFMSRNTSDLSDTKTIYQIRNLYSRSEEIAGLFGTVSGGSITGIGLVNGDIAASSGGTAGSTAGGIAGQLIQGNITRCYNRKEGSGSSRVAAAGGTSSGGFGGGIAGRVNEAGLIVDCYNLDTEITAAGNGARVGGITGALGATGSIQNCYNAVESGGKLEAPEGGQVGSIAGYAMNAGMILRCWRDGAFATDQTGISDFGAVSGTNRQDQTNALNTLEGTGERTGEFRAWYTSVSSEATRGLPTLEPPVILTAAVNPADVTESGGTLTGSTGTLTGGTLPASVLYRGLRQEKGVSQLPAFTLTEKPAVTANYHTYGSDNANEKLVLEAGNTDLSGLTSSLVQPTTVISNLGSLTLYTGAAYTCPDKRILLLDLAAETGSGADAAVTRYEVRVEVQGMTRNTLSVTLPVKSYIELSPGVNTKAYTTDLSIINHDACPVKFGITGVNSKETTEDGIDQKLAPIAKSMTIDNTKTINEVKLGIEGKFTDPSTGALGIQEYYYTPADGAAAASWLNCEIGYSQKLDYRYFIEHSLVHAGEARNFGFDIIYQFGIPTGNVGSVVNASAN